MVYLIQRDCQSVKQENFKNSYEIDFVDLFIDRVVKIIRQFLELFLGNGPSIANPFIVNLPTTTTSTFLNDSGNVLMDDGIERQIRLAATTFDSVFRNEKSLENGNFFDEYEHTKPQEKNGNHLMGYESDSIWTSPGFAAVENNASEWES